MFCPKCAAENEQQQGYCRHCGQALSGVHLALEGNAEQSLEKLKVGQKWIGGGSDTLLSFSLIALVIAILGVALHDLSFGYIAFINLILGSFIGLPLVYFGKAKVKRAARLLSEYQGESTTHSALYQAQRSEGLLTTGLNPDLSRLPGPDSVTEHTTLDLRKADGARRVPRESL